MPVWGRASLDMKPFARLKQLYSSLGRTDRVLVWLLILTAVPAWAFSAGAFVALARLAFFVEATWAAFRATRYGLRKAIWRLRNRLLVAYLFIAVVPVLLITALIGLVLYAYTGQVAVYLVSSELDRRATQLRGMAQYLARIDPAERDDWIRGAAPYLRERLPGLELQVAGATDWSYPPGVPRDQPPKGWRDVNGLLVKDELLYLWAHVNQNGNDVTVLLPITHDFLGDLVPGLGEVSIVALDDVSRAARRLRIARFTASDTAARSSRNRLPEPYNRYDREVRWGAPIPLHVWKSPGQTEDELLRLRTRPSAVMGTILGQKIAPSESLVSVLFVFFGTTFIIVELISLFIGIVISRTITTAVHNLYEGTERVMHGDFSHRIEVKGGDQLAELSRSFNRMTENVERLLIISKEKERLQSEIEIAREVQNQLFPKTVPSIGTLNLTAHCNPARMVSGDYYDYQALDDSRIALAVGDVAGKGISAALLMATVQSSLRTQIRTCLEYGATAGNGSSRVSVSTSRLVSQLNQQLHTYTSAEKFATFYFGIYDDPSGVLTYTNAGHLPPIVFRRHGVTRLEVNGMVVGAFPFAEYEESRVELEPGDLLVCYTDGITEPENEYGEMFGEDRLIEVVTRHANHDSGEIVSAVMRAVGEWTGSSELQDDMTLLLARRQ